MRAGPQWWNLCSSAPCTGPACFCRLRQLALDVAYEHVGEVVREALPHDDAQRGEVGAVGGEGVGRHLPAALAQGIRDVEDGEVVDVVLELECEDRQLVAARQQLERADLGDLRREARRDVPRVGLNCVEAVESQAQERVVLRHDLRARAARS